MSIRPSGSFILLYTDFGLQVRYDGSHLVEVTVPSSYSGRLCGLCGEFPGHLQAKRGRRAGVRPGPARLYIKLGEEKEEMNLGLLREE